MLGARTKPRIPSPVNVSRSRHDTGMSLHDHTIQTNQTRDVDRT